MNESVKTCDDCGTRVPSEDQRVFIDPNTFCLDCFDATCSRCSASVVNGDDRVQKFGEYFCTECAERLCYDCGKYIDDLNNRNVVRGFVRCQECTWCIFDNLCCGCGTDISDSIEMVIVDGSHQFCAECKDELPADANIEEYPFREEAESESNNEAPF